MLNKRETESLGTWAMNGPTVYHPWMTDEYGTLVEQQFAEETEVLGRKSTPVPLGPL